MSINLKTESARAHRTTVLINEADHEFMKAKKYKPTNLLRAKIQELKKRDDGSHIDYERANEKLHLKINKMLEAMQKVITEEQFKQIITA